MTRLRLPAAMLLTATTLAGCGRAPAPEFTPSAKVGLLLPEIRDGMTAGEPGAEQTRLPGVEAEVAAKFGTLADPVVWPLLPVDFGGSPATVTEVVASAEPREATEKEKAPSEVVVRVAPAKGGTLPDVPAGSFAAWKSGEYEDAAHRVKAFDPQTGTATLVGDFPDGPPAAGDECLIGAGTLLTKGRSLYARHCMHCHGPGGAGDGPTARYLFPKPRDYRLGVFKFTSTSANDKASRDDLLRVLHHGVPGTSMPAFRLLPADELHALVEYVRWLSMRGEYETKLAESAAGADMTTKAVAELVAEGMTRPEAVEDLDVKGFLEGDFVDTVEFTGEDLADAWTTADEEDAVLLPKTARVADTPESRARGFELYRSDRTKCATCHGVYGRGDGSQVTSFQTIPGTTETYPRPGLYDAWNEPIKPRDLTRGVFHGGRRPVDLYRRMAAGIKGTPMPAFGGTLSDQELWDLVNFVLHAPYDALPDPGAGKALVTAGH